MQSPSLFLLSRIASSFVCLLCIQTQGATTAYYHWLEGTYATDKRGVRHSSKDYPNCRPPWLADLITGVAPQYSYSDRAGRYQGSGWFGLKLDLSTGDVTNVTVSRSTGFKSLDDSAVSAFHKWRWKPGKWKEIDIPVTFKLERGVSPLPSGAVRLPSAR
jgi:TonB family protein